MMNPGKLLIKKKISGLPTSSKKHVVQDVSIIDEPQKKITNNELLLRELEGMIKVSMVGRDKWRERSYRKAVESIKLCPYEIKSGRQAQQLEGIGKSIGAKIDEILANGKLDIVTKEKNGVPALSIEEVNQIYELTKINGIGPVKATKLVVEHGITDIDELYDNTELLNNNQKKGLKYFKDTNELIPRAEINQHELLLKRIMPDDIEFVIAGSYRRGAKVSGDIDIILKTIGADSTETEAYRVDRFQKLIKELHSIGYLIDDLTKPHYKYNGYCQLSKTDKVRRIDLLYVSPAEYPFSLLYFTGSKSFNQKMRYMILADGYSLNESHLMNTKLEKQVTDYNFQTEQDIFDYLGLSWVPPVLRDNPNLLVRVENSRKSIIENTHIDIVPKKEYDVIKKQIPKKLLTLRKKNIENSDNANTKELSFAIGTHMSLQEFLSINKMIESIVEFGGGIIQFYLGGIMHLTDENIEEIKKLLKQNGVQYIVHGNLTYNFCQVNCTAFRNRLVNELVLANRLGADVVIHQGKYSDIVKKQLGTREEALDMYCQNIGEIIDIMKEKGLNNKIILENSAKQGGELGYDIDDLAYIHNSFTEEQKKYIGYCIDLCHGFTAGVMDVRSAECMKTWFNEFDRQIGNKYFRLIHFNDCNTKIYQCNDDHADLLTGYIGNSELGGSTEGYKYISNYARENNIPLVIEAPSKKLDGIPIAQQINYIKKWLTK